MNETILILYLVFIPNRNEYIWNLEETLFIGETSILEIWGMWSHPYIVINPRQMLTQRGTTCKVYLFEIVSIR